AAHRRVQAPRHDHVQRLRRPRRGHVRGHGPGQELLSAQRDSVSGTGVVAGERPGRARPAPAQSRDKAAQKRWRRISHLGLWALTLTPAVVTLVDTFTWNLGVDPIETL